MANQDDTPLIRDEQSRAQVRSRQPIKIKRKLGMDGKVRVYAQMQKSLPKMSSPKLRSIQGIVGSQVQIAPRQLTRSQERAQQSKRIKKANEYTQLKQIQARLAKEQLDPVYTQKYPSRAVEKLAIEAQRWEEAEFRRQRGNVPMDIVKRRDDMHQAELKKRREWAQKHNVMNAHKWTFKVQLPFLDMDGENNILNAENRFSDKISKENDFHEQAKGRPTIWDTPNYFATEHADKFRGKQHKLKLL